MTRYTIKKSKKSYKKPILIMGSALLVAFGLLFVLEKADVINLYESKLDTSSDQTTRGVNEVDYSPATSTDNDEINQKKEDGTIGQTPTPPAQDASIQISFIANGQDEDGGPLVIRTILGGIVSGTCQILLTNGSATVTKTIPVSLQNTTYSCNLDVPFAELSAGEWNIELKVNTSDGRTNAATATAILG